ncbi:MAG: amidohydrolase family protein [Clostridia bacterium]|nr:amidohydrolase family protein [Clostridia bacterium]
MFSLNVTDYDRQVYEKELVDFLPEEFVDFHVHSYKNTFTPRGTGNGGSTWPLLVADEMTTEQMQDCFKQLFPKNKVIPLVFGGCRQVLDQTNNYVKEEAEKCGYPKLYRSAYEMDPEELEKNVNEGGFLGLKPYLSNRPPYIPASETRIFDFLPHEHLKVADKNGWIIMLHIPRDLRLKDKVNIAQLMEIEEKYPNVKLVVAHIGRAYSKEDIGDAFDTLGKTKNMYFDFTANVCDDAIEACIKAVGTKRLIFGSDLPISIMRMYRIVENGVYYNVVPRGLYGDVDGEPHMRQTDEKDVTLMIYEQIRALKRVAEKLNLTREDVEDILCNNAKRLLGMK